MPKLDRLLPLALATALAAGAAFADQTTPPAAPPAAGTGAADGLSLGAATKEGAQVGDYYLLQNSADWDVRCIKAQAGKDPCELFQLLKDDKANPVAEISIFGLPAGQPAAAGATIVAPLGTLLTQDVTLQIDDGTAKRYPFSWCDQAGCYARVGFTQAEVDSMQKGKQAVMSIVPVAAPDQRVTLTISLKGFSTGYDAVNKANGL